jgi:chorismate mutase / prephenate dehydratase
MGKLVMTDDVSNELGEIRKKLDNIDSTFLSLLKDRLSLAREVGRIKSKDSRSKWDPLREKQIYERLLKDNNGEFPSQSLLSIFNEIITTCRISQQQVEVAFLGPEATFTHLAGVKHFGQSAIYRPTETIEDVFVDVDRGRVTYGIVPVENSIEGSVTSTLDSFIKYRVKACGEVKLGITHNLVSYTDDISRIKKVVSHAQPLAQCRQWLKKNLPGVPTQAVFSTSAAAKMAMEDHEVAAIASSLAIKTYQLQELVKGIEDYRGNTTRFLVIGKNSPSKSGIDKTSLLVGLGDRPGALNQALSILAKQEINLTKIESRPVKDEPGKYLFFLDMEGHWDDPLIKEGCERLKDVCAFFEWLGSYPVSKAEL